MPKLSTVDRWATFDCYGTLIDWELGIRAALGNLWPDSEPRNLLARYHEIEPRVQAEPFLPYREVMARTLEGIAEAEGVELRPLDRETLAASLPTWPAFPEVRGSLEEVASRGWRLGILSNTDPDLLAASILNIGVQPDLVVTAHDAGSYKPAHEHWNVFRGRTQADRARHVHVAASLFHDIAPAAELGVPAIWINRLGESSELPSAAELPDLAGLPDLLDKLVPDE
ncbi:MAG TPA: HAD family hydrolase [Actinomycetota bacterium]|nr:HAD family hydrolase [Actinomycetota bacterium]